MAKQIGKVGEEFIERLSRVAFLPDFVHANPLYKRGKFLRELCDVALLFDRTLVVFQIKTADSDTYQQYDLNRKLSWRSKQAKKAASQVDGAVRSLENGTSCEVQLRDGSTSLIDISKFDRCFGLVILDHDYERPEDITLERVGAESNTQTLFLTFREFQEMCTALSTAGDLLDYLDFRLNKIKSIMFMGGGELDLVAMYVSKHEEFTDSERYDSVLVEEGCWSAYCKQRSDPNRLDALESSYLIDDMAIRLFEAREYSDPFSVNYDEIGEHSSLPLGSQRAALTHLLASMRRFEREAVGTKLRQKSEGYLDTGMPRYFIFRTTRSEFVLFVVCGDERAIRVNGLGNFLLAAKHRFGVAKIYGFVVPPLSDPDRVIDAIILDFPLAEHDLHIPPNLQEFASNMFASPGGLKQS